MDKSLGASMHLEKQSLITLDGATVIVPCVLLKFFRGIFKRVKMKHTARVLLKFFRGILKRVKMKHTPRPECTFPPDNCHSGHPGINSILFGRSNNTIEHISPFDLQNDGDFIGNPNTHKVNLELMNELIIQKEMTEFLGHH